ncbi:MAG: hypothetical protein JWQ89_1954 [Devosia sp.]|uniref:MotE family protein n=1 Tax=Devosia sp. TaxID=1871048 RepID=UPI00261B6611|nr:hypothetical protein [Devosia sp.]MDB5540227.1 hypothetical protein [Devosia sp.]
MKTPRLLPVVIAAATALLLFKGIGLVTTGGYVLTGPGSAIAAGGAQPGGGAAATAEGRGDPTMALPADATMDDNSPTLDDGAPVLPLGPNESSETVPSEGENGAAPVAGGEQPAEAIPALESNAEAAAAHAASKAETTLCPPTRTASPGVPAEAVPQAEAAAGTGEHGAVEAPADCVPIPVNEHGDALPMEMNSSGVLAPMAAEPGSQEDLLGRLGERRDSLDVREQELEMRMALVEAAEKRIEERTAALKAIEARINALVDEKKSAEKEQFVGIVAMYETMKAKEAATIFNQLDLAILVKVARAMNPRKMAPILARMDPAKAQQLTAGLTADEGEPSLDVAAEDLNSLPQIIGQ